MSVPIERNAIAQRDAIYSLLSPLVVHPDQRVEDETNVPKEMLRGHCGAVFCFELGEKRMMEFARVAFN